MSTNKDQYKMKPETIHEERNALRIFFDTVSDMEPQDSTVSASKIVKTTQNRLKDILRGSEHRCTCAKMTWGGICETCQGSDEDLFYLRKFFIQIRNAEKNGLTGVEIQALIETTREYLAT